MITMRFGLAAALAAILLLPLTAAAKSKYDEDRKIAKYAAILAANWRPQGEKTPIVPIPTPSSAVLTLILAGAGLVCRRKRNLR